MADITQLPVMTAADAESIGFARFNDVPTLPIDIPDGNFTISAKTTDGRRITFSSANTSAAARQASSTSNITTMGHASPTRTAVRHRPSTC